MPEAKATDGKHTDGAGNGGNSSTSPLLGKTWTIIFGTLVLVGFAILLIYVTKRASTKDQTLWDRLIYVYGSLEAMAFAVIGAVFGTTVQRQVTNQANKRADANGKQAQAERSRADQHQKDATNGRALAGVIKAEAGAQLVPGTMAAMDVQTAARTAEDAVAAHNQRLLAAARELFPDA
jgi:cell shape-determining protein MreC